MKRTRSQDRSSVRTKTMFGRRAVPVAVRIAGAAGPWSPPVAHAAREHAPADAIAATDPRRRREHATRDRGTSTTGMVEPGGESFLKPTFRMAKGGGLRSPA
jgi:hypothetical protein